MSEAEVREIVLVEVVGPSLPKVAGVNEAKTVELLTILRPGNYSVKIRSNWKISDQIGSYSIELDQIRTYSIKLDYIRSNWIWIDQIGSKIKKLSKKKNNLYFTMFWQFFYDFFSVRISTEDHAGITEITTTAHQREVQPRTWVETSRANSVSTKFIYRLIILRKSLNFKNWTTVLQNFKSNSDKMANKMGFCL